MKIAIVIPAYNCESYVEATLKSLMEQGDSLPRVDRIILSDDCSSDRTIEVGRAAWKGPIPLDVFEAPQNRGEYQNMNEAVARLPKDVEWFLIMHADNVAKSGWLAMLLDRVEAADERIGTISTSWDDWYEDGRIVPGENRHPPIPERIRGDRANVAGTLLKGCWWHISSCAIRVQAYREVGGLPLGLRLKGDWDFLLRLLSSGWDVEYVPSALMRYRANPAGSSSVSFRTHRDVLETLAVAQRHQNALSVGRMIRFHGQQLETLARRFVGGVIRGAGQRALRTWPTAFCTLRSLGECLWERALGRRHFRWVSSSDPRNEARVAVLKASMARFHKKLGTRDGSECLVDAGEAAGSAIERALLRAVLDARPVSVLEVGCGSGRTYRQLREKGYGGAYTGAEISAEATEENRRRFPEAKWVAASEYDLPVADESQDCVIACYVLQRCACPERFLIGLLRAVRSGGSLFLVFPDFGAGACFVSQRLGLSEGSPSDHLVAGRLLHALVALYDSRIRLPRALRQARRKIGPFPVNLRPRCLEASMKIEPDMDAVYISTPEEIVEWANGRGLKVSFPGGRERGLHCSVLVQLDKPVSRST